MPRKPDRSTDDVMNTFLRDALQRRRGAPPADETEAAPVATPPPAPSIDAGARSATTPDPDMNAFIRQRLGRA
jgi:hypothetical protein